MTATLTIDLRAIRANWRSLADMIAPAECAAVVKADGYGCGLERVVGALLAEGCRTFFVARSMASGPTNGTSFGRASMIAVNGMRGMGPCCQMRHRSASALRMPDGMAAMPSWRPGFRSSGASSPGR